MRGAWESNNYATLATADSHNVVNDITEGLVKAGVTPGDEVVRVAKAWETNAPAQRVISHKHTEGSQSNRALAETMLKIG